jgi:hypothetical protein
LKLNYSKALFICSICLLFLACTSKPTTPEDEIRLYLKKGVEAAENRDHGDLTDLIDDAYLDQKGVDKSRIATLLRAYFFRHKNIYLFTKIRDISFSADNEAEVTLHVAMAGSVISDASALASLRARMYRFELQLVKQDEWLLRSANWQIANMVDMQ